MVSINMIYVELTRVSCDKAASLTTNPLVRKVWPTI